MVVGTLDTHSASAGDKLTGITGNGDHDGRFFIEINSTVKFSTRTNQLDPNAEVAFPAPITLSGGDTVELKIETDFSVGDYFGKLLIE